MKLYPDVRSIFILPPSASEQRKRIEKRGSNTPEQIEKRMKIAQDEIKCWPKYDCVIVNETGCTKKTVEKIAAVMEGTLPDQVGIENLIENYFNC